MDRGKVQKRSESGGTRSDEMESGDSEVEAQRGRGGAERVDDECSNGGGLGDLAEGVAGV